MDSVTSRESNKQLVDRIYRLVAVFAAAYFCFSFLLLHIVRDDLSLWHTTLSIYAVGPAGWVLTLGFYAIALTQCLIAYRYYQFRRSRGDLVTAGTLALAAFGIMLVALFPYTIKQPHNIGAVLQLGLFPVSLSLRVILRRDDVLRIFSLIVALLCNLGFLLMLTDGVVEQDLYSLGFVEKAEIVCIALWSLCYSWFAFAPHADSSQTSAAK